MSWDCSLFSVLLTGEKLQAERPHTAHVRFKAEVGTIILYFSISGQDCYNGAWLKEIYETFIKCI